MPEQKEKTCFVIMPISDMVPYAVGHFDRVYEFIIEPACKAAGFIPIRADNVLNTNYIILDVIRLIIESDMAICDLSAKNANVFYELGIRQAFNLPVTLIRDSTSERAFDIQGFRDIEYDEHLRIDNVKRIVESIATTLTNTYHSKGKEVNSLVSLLGIHPAKISENLEISKETQLILSTLKSLENRLMQAEDKIEKSSASNVIKVGDTFATIDLTVEESYELKPGDLVEHAKFGIGEFRKMEGSKHNRIGTIHFKTNGEKKVMMNYVQLKKVIIIPRENS
jgi:transcription-repair coupling factor (superfamily II helicase)